MIIIILLLYLDPLLVYMFTGTNETSLDTSKQLLQMNSSEK